MERIICLASQRAEEKSGSLNDRISVNAFFFSPLSIPRDDRTY